MKTLIKSLLVATSFTCLTVVPNAHATNIQNEQSLIQVCKAAQNDNPTRFRVAVRHSGKSLEELTEGLVCNGQSLIDFAAQANSKKLVEFLERKSGDNANKLFIAKK